MARRQQRDEQPVAEQEPAADLPVYDERGNVRPRGTEGARPMTFEERVEIAERLGSTEG